jgi:hypothetical protein
VTDDPRARFFLRLDEVALEDVDQDVALTGPERVLPQLDNRAFSSPFKVVRRSRISAAARTARSASSS